MKKLFNDINIFIFAFHRACKESTNFILETSEDSFYISDLDCELNQSYYSLNNRCLALRNPYPMENFFYLTANFYQHLDKEKKYSCISHAYTLMLLKEMHKRDIITELVYERTMPLDLNDLRLSLGVESRNKKTKMYNISFKKRRNFTLNDLLWINEYAQLMNFPHQIKYTIQNDLVLLVLPVEYNLSLAKVKVLGNLLRDILELSKTITYDISYSTQHYYDIMKKCQILTK